MRAMEASAGSVIALTIVLITTLGLAAQKKDEAMKQQVFYHR